MVKWNLELKALNFKFQINLECSGLVWIYIELGFAIKKIHNRSSVIFKEKYIYDTEWKSINQMKNNKLYHVI